MATNGVTGSSAPSSSASTSSTSTTTSSSPPSSTPSIAHSLSPRPGVVGSAVKRRDYTWRSYTAAEVAAHQSSDSMWVIIHGKVYDVHAFLEDHPGGPEILTQHAGKDATADFEETFHSDAARQQLKDYVIGGVEGYSGADDAATAGRKKAMAASAAAGGGLKTSGGGGGVSPMLIVAGGVILLAVATYLLLPHLRSH
jgi:cytochrome b involved in lipid metabolism